MWIYYYVLALQKVLNPAPKLTGPILSSIAAEVHIDITYCGSHMIGYRLSISAFVGPHIPCFWH